MTSVPPFLCPCCAARAPSPRRDWCANEIAELRRRYKYGESVESIAQDLGRTADAVRTAARQHNIPRVLRSARRLRCARCGGLTGLAGACAACDGEARP